MYHPHYGPGHLGWPYLLVLITLLLVTGHLLAPPAHPLERRESSLAALLFWLLLPLALFRVLLFKLFNRY